MAFDPEDVGDPPSPLTDRNLRQMNIQLPADFVVWLSRKAGDLSRRDEEGRHFEPGHVLLWLIAYGAMILPKGEEAAELEAGMREQNCYYSLEFSFNSIPPFYRKRRPRRR